MHNGTGNSSPKRIMVAEDEAAHPRIRRALAQQYVLRFVTTLAQAKSKLLSEEFDLVLSGVHFDESRMFELLDFVAKDERLSELSFLVVQALHSQEDAASHAAKNVAPLLGACEAVKVCHLREDAGDDVLRDAVARCLEKPVKEKRARLLS